MNYFEITFMFNNSMNYLNKFSYLKRNKNDLIFKKIKYNLNCKV